MGLAFPYWEGKGGEAGADPSVGTSGDSLGSLAGCPQDKDFSSVGEENTPGQSSLGKSADSGGLRASSLEEAKQRRRPQAEEEVVQVADESRRVGLQSLFHLGTPGSFLSPCHMASLFSIPARPPPAGVSPG